MYAGNTFVKKGMTLEKQKNIAAWTTTIRIALGFYIYGATVLEVFVYYPAWQHISGGWIPFKVMIDQLIIPFYVVPCFLVLIPATLMFWYGHSNIHRWQVWAYLITLLIPTISTMTIQLPIQLELENGFDQELYRRLRSTDLVYQWIAAFFGVVINGWSSEKCKPRQNITINGTVHCNSTFLSQTSASPPWDCNVQLWTAVWR